MYINPYAEYPSGNPVTLRGNFHTHCGTGPFTCGLYEIDDVVHWYKEAGYGVLGITNHDCWKDVRHLESKYDIILLNGYEYSRDSHMVCNDVTSDCSGPHQVAIDQANNEGGFTIICHPHWQKEDYWDIRRLDQLKGYIGIEIYNTVIFRMDGSGLATDVWDHLLSQGKKVWGFANDDFHRWFDLARAWDVFWVKEKTKAAFDHALRTGSFYASSGLILHEFSFENNKLFLKATSKETFVKTNRYIFIGEGGKVLKDMTEEFGEYQLTGKESYVRVQVISEHGAMLWTQPVYRKDVFEK